MYDVGNIFLVPHMLLNSRRHLWKATLEEDTGRIETIENLCWLKRRAGKGDEATYLVQMVDKPGQAIAILKV